RRRAIIIAGPSSRLAQIDMLETVPSPMLDVARHIHAKEKTLAVIDGRYAIRTEKVARVFRENQCLLPTRARPVRCIGLMPSEPLPHDEEPGAFNDFKRQLLCLCANLRALNITLRN